MLSIPIINAKSTAETRPVYLSELRRAEADRVFLFAVNPFGDEVLLRKEMSVLAENIAYYEAAGLEVGVWIGGFGHGGPLSHDVRTVSGHYTHIRGLATGGGAEDSFCPSDPEYDAMYRDFIRRVALTGTKMIMIDDDLRLSLHGAAIIGCACDRHMAMFNEQASALGLIDHEYTREELAGVLLTGKTNPLRRVWLALMRDTLCDFAAGLRETVDSVDPAIRLGHCACLPTWDVDGADSIELARIFAGKTRPFLRLIGAPYWTDGRGFHTTGLGSIINLERMQLKWCRETAPEIEVFTEGDAYPRPRYNVPALYLDGFHQVIEAEGQSDGILKYMIDYTYHPLYETGYIDRHNRFAALREEMKQVFSGKRTAGVYIHEVMHKLLDMDCTGLSEDEIVSRFTPASANFAAATALPVSFARTEYTETMLVFGENAKYLGEEWKKIPMILDASAAQILTERGTDVGLAACEPMVVPATEFFPEEAETLSIETGGSFFRMTPAEGAKVASTFDEGVPAAYTYENKEGIRFLVYAFSAEGLNYSSALIRSYPRQAQLFRAIAWMQKKPLPAEVRKEPGAYVLCRKSGDEMAVGIWNFGHDLVLPGSVPLDGMYREIFGIGDTKAVLDGNSALIENMVFPGGFAGFLVRK